MANDLPPARVSAQARHHLFLVAKEAFNNVVKHAGAGEVRIDVAVRDEAWQLTIADNGRGIASPPSTSNSQPSTRGHGLRNMRQRVESLGGRFTIERNTEGGATVRVEVPLSNLSAA